MMELSVDRLHIQVYNEAHPDLMLSVMILGGVDCTTLPSSTVARSAPNQCLTALYNILYKGVCVYVIMSSPFAAKPAQQKSAIDFCTVKCLPKNATIFNVKQIV